MSDDNVAFVVGIVMGVIMGWISMLYFQSREIAIETKTKKPPSVTAYYTLRGTRIEGTDTTYIYKIRR